MLLALAHTLRGDLSSATHALSHSSWLHITTGASLIFTFLAVVYYAIRSAYRVYFHPLSSFPGPQSAALSTEWTLAQDNKLFSETYYDELHKQYKAHAIRIGPNELHISDPEVYQKIYRQRTPYLKDKTFYGAFGIGNAMFPTTDQEYHKNTRKILNPMFSHGQMFKYEEVMQEKLNVLLEKMERLGQVDVAQAFRCYASDVVSEVAFAKSFDMLTESPDSFRSGIIDADDLENPTFTRAHRPRLTKVIDSLPEFIAQPLGLRENRRRTGMFQKFSSGAVQSHEQHGNTTSHPVVFDKLDAFSTPAKVREGITFIVAGSDTTAATLCGALLYILQRPDVEAKLREELQRLPSFRTFSDKSQDGTLDLKELESAHYLDAVIRETLRLRGAAPARLPRVVPPPSSGEPPLVVDGRTVPAGTVVAMSSYSLHHDASVWGPDVDRFRPERWLEDAARAKELEHYWAPFSKGERNCIGMNLALSETRMVLAGLLARFDLKLLAASGMDNAKDGFGPQTEAGEGKLGIRKVMLTVKYMGGVVVQVSALNGTQKS